MHFLNPLLKCSLITPLTVKVKFILGLWFSTYSFLNVHRILSNKLWGSLYTNIYNIELISNGFQEFKILWKSPLFPQTHRFLHKTILND